MLAPVKKSRLTDNVQTDICPPPLADDDEDDYGDIWRDSEGVNVYDQYLNEKIRIGTEVEVASIEKMELFLGLQCSDNSETPSHQPQWQFSSLKDKIKVEESMVLGSIWQAVKASTVIKASKMDILTLIMDNSRIHEYDDMFDFSKLLVTVNDRTVIRRLCYKPIWPTAPRDFLCCITWTELEDGSLLICSRFVPNKFLKVQEDFVRGYVDITGYWIQPCHLLEKNDPHYDPADTSSSCKVTLVVHTDLGGTLPTWIINLLITEAPVKVLTKISIILEEERAKINSQ